MSVKEREKTLLSSAQLAYIRFTAAQADVRTRVWTYDKTNAAAYAVCAIKCEKKQRPFKYIATRSRGQPADNTVGAI